MNTYFTMDQVYRTSAQPVVQLRSMVNELEHWYKTFPDHNYLQPCVIDGNASLVCRKQLGKIAPLAFRALKSICEKYGVYLKEDVRTESNESSIFQNRRKLAVVLTFCFGVAQATQAATVGRQSFISSSSSISASAIVLAFDRQTLSDVTSEIAKQTGMRFHFDADLGQDLIDIKINAFDWKSALGQLLLNYNFTTIQEANNIKAVIISGYKGGKKPSAAKGTNNAKTNALSASLSVDNKDTIVVTIPFSDLTSLQVGSEIPVELPGGVFTVKQESMVTLDNGTLSWVGIMDDGNDLYKLYLTKIHDGKAYGSVFTPDGAYNIDTVGDQTVMIAVAGS